MPPLFTAIAAMSENRVIGAGNRIPWHLPDDFKWFRRMTTGHTIVMGRKTFESIGRALPDRTHIVLSRGDFSWPGVVVVRSWEEIQAPAGQRIFICGGADIYRQALPRCGDLYLTQVKRVVAGDAFFPPFEDEFELEAEVMNVPEFAIFHFRRRALG